MRDIYGNLISENAAEKVTLKNCVAGDVVYIGYSPNNSWKNVGKVKLVKIKNHPNGGLQIKYQSVCRYNGANIHKMNIPGKTMVERYLQKPVGKQEEPEILVVGTGDLKERVDHVARIVEASQRAGMVLHPATTAAQIENMTPSEKMLFNVCMDKMINLELSYLWSEKR